MSRTLFTRIALAAALLQSCNVASFGGDAKKSSTLQRRAFNDGGKPKATTDQGSGGDGRDLGRETHAGGKGELRVPVRIRIPEGATTGSYRLTVASNGTTSRASSTSSTCLGVAMPIVSPSEISCTPMAKRASVTFTALEGSTRPE